MNQNQNDSLDFNRRDFLKSGSVATLMTMLGGVELFAQTNAAPAAAKAGPKIKVAVVGLGARGREILNTLARLPQADVSVICENYPAFLKRAASAAPSAAQVPDYKAVLENKDIKAVILATPTHQHKDLAIAALKSGKHVYCEMPLAHTMEDARDIALAAKAVSQTQVFQSGLQFRSDKQRLFLMPFVRSGALGRFVMARAQWHKKQSWRATSPNPEREKTMNWRLDKATSLGLIGELGVHQLDEACWVFNARPVAVSGSGTTVAWQDGRTVPDTVQAVLEFPGGIFLQYGATLANSFDANHEVYYGSDAAVMLRENKAWMFKEVDSPLLGWEVYAMKETFYKETGIVLRAGASKSVQNAEPTAEELITSSPLFYSLENFVRNAADVAARVEDLKESLGEVDPEEVAKVPRRAAAGYLEGYQATVTAIKANEAITTAKRIELKPEWYELA